MTLTEINKIHSCRENMGSILNAKSRKFIIEMHELCEVKPYWNLSAGRRRYLNNIYSRLVMDGVIKNPVDDIAA